MQIFTFHMQCSCFKKNFQYYYLDFMHSLDARFILRGYTLLEQLTMVKLQIVVHKLL